MATFDDLTVTFDSLVATFDETTADVAITTTTVARAVLIPRPHMGEVLGEDIVYLLASHDPSIVKVARRGTPKRGSHTPVIVKHAGYRPSYERTASANQPAP